MAVALRITDLRIVFISLTWERIFTSEHTARIGVGSSEVEWILERLEGFQGGIAVADRGFALEQLLMRFDKDQLAILIYDKKSGNRLHSEPLSFHQSFFMPFFDFARSERFPPFMAPSYEKPEFLAIFTHAYNEDDMLTMWERHYSNLTPNRHLYVIDHGSTSFSREMLNGGTNVVPIPRGTVDHANISGFCNYFQRFLLTQYKWVIHVDCDEFLIYQGGVEAFRTKLAATALNVIIQPKHAYDVIHDYRSEPPLENSELVSKQRSILKTSPAYKKPIIASIPTTWILGFHGAFENHALIEDESLWMIHLAFADIERNLGRQARWKNAPQSEAVAHFVPETERPDTLVALQRKYDGLLDAEGIEVPEWMRGMF
jgi:hypothetical protein